MKLLLDNQLPMSLAQALNRHGFDSRHVIEARLDSADDSTIWEYAIQHDLVIVTKDADFAQRSIQSGAASPQILWVRYGNTRKAALIQEFLRLIPKIEHALSSGTRLVEIP